MNIQPKINYGLLCDDVRREDNGKLIVIGMYSSDIQLLELPSPFAFCMVLSIENDVERDMSISIIAKLDDVTAFQAKLEVRLPKGTALLSTPPMPVLIKQASLLKVCVSANGTEQEVWSGKVTLRKSLAPS